MFKWQLKAEQQWRIPHQPIETAFVILNVSDPEASVEIQFEGPERLVGEVRAQLIGSYGERGRVIEETATAFDVNNSMHNWLMAPFEPELVEGAKLFDHFHNQ